MTATDKASPRRAIIVAGPTCSGKSALALALARRFGGTVINADSMQIYRELRILTARPTVAEEAAAPHRLYGVRAAAEAGSVGWWRVAALAAMDAAAVPILCGGTGMYLRSLTAGLADIPAIDPAIRAEARALSADAPALHTRLAALDPVTAAALRPGDSQRVARAWEVWRQTGHGLAHWQRHAAPPADYLFRVILLDPPRDALRQASAIRFDGMLAEGALSEVEALRHLDSALPAMRAHGVQELGAYLAGAIDLEEATQRSVVATMQYTKRQATWFRHQTLAPPAHTDIIYARYEECAQFSESWMAGMQQFLRGND